MHGFYCATRRELDVKRVLTMWSRQKTDSSPTSFEIKSRLRHTHKYAGLLIERKAAIFVHLLGEKCCVCGSFL